METDSGLSLFDYLKPSPQILPLIKHDKDYIKKGKRSKSQRRIWQTVPYDEYEQEKMQDFVKEVQKEGLQFPPDWLPSDTLKMCYISKFKPKNYVKNLREHIQWRANPLSHNPTDLNVAFLQKGIIYTLGKDKQSRPIIIMNIELVNLKQFSEDVYLNALSFFLHLVTLKFFVPGLIENWVFIIDTKKLGLTQFPFKALGSAIQCMQVNFCGCLDKLYILNPSSSLSFSWKMISAMGDPDSISKISFLKPKEYSKMIDRIPANQLEQQFGGQVPNLTRFWPPINLDIPGGYPEQVLKVCDSWQVAKIEIQKETPTNEEDEAKLQAQLANLKIPQQEPDDDA